MSLMDILHGVAQVPEAIGGGALDILIGDRTNVSPGEQAKRVAQAILLGGENGQNLLALQHLNAQADRGNQQAVSAPDFQGAVATLMHQGVPGDQAYARIARMYGVSGYAPDYSSPTPIDAPADRSGLESPSIQQSRVPLLPPPSAQAQVKYAASQEQLRGISRPGAEGAYSLAQLAKINPDLATQRQLLDDALGRYSRPGQTSQKITFQDGKLAGTIEDLSRADAFFPSTPEGRNQAIVAADFYNKFSAMVGSASTLVPAIDPRGGISLREDRSDEAASFGRVRGEERARHTPLGATTPSSASAAPLSAPSAPAVTGGAPAASAPLAATFGSIDTAGMTPAELDQLDDARKKDLDLKYQTALKRYDTQLKGLTLDQDQRKRLSQIAATRAWLASWTDLALNGRRDRNAPEKFASGFPESARGLGTAQVEGGRQMLAGYARDPFFIEMDRLKAMGRPILARNLGGDVGNLSQYEQEAVDNVQSARAKDEVRNAVYTLNQVLKNREDLVLSGKEAAFNADQERVRSVPAPQLNGQPTPQATPAPADAPAAPSVTRDQAIAELRRRGKL